MKRFFVTALLLMVAIPAQAQESGSAQDAETIPLEDFVKQSDYSSLSLSPDGNRVAITAPAGDQTGLVVLDISDLSSMSSLMSFRLDSGEHIADVFWANNERILFTTALQQGALNQPRPTGRIYAVDADGSNRKQLYGTREGSRVARQSQVLSLLPDQENFILLATYAHDRSRPYAERLDLRQYNRTIRETISPLDNGGLLADHNGVVRFAFGTNEEREAQYAYRADEDSEWTSFETDFDLDHVSVHGFAENNRDVYLTTRETGRMGLYRLNTETGESERLLGSDTVEISDVLWSRDGDYVIGAILEDGQPEMQFIDPDDPTSVLQRQIAAAFPRQFSRVVSFASDSDRAIVAARADISPAGYFLFDTESLSADFLLSSRPWIDPNQMLPVEPVQFESRDGRTIHGYLIEPADAEDSRPHPTIVRVHGGPHGIRDRWRFDPELQLFANRGYAVMTVNYRGSGGYGSEFEEAGYGEWGRAMQDDVTDATRWLMEQGIADSDNTCIYGASYGGYATLSGVTREPDLYACGAANVGVYDLPLMFEEGDISERVRGRAYLQEVLGDDQGELEARSPARQVDRIQAPLFLAHGEEDIRAHVDHFHFLTDRLDEAETEYESLLFEGEGHGYYELENRVEYWSELLEFFDRHIGQ